MTAVRSEAVDLVFRGPRLVRGRALIADLLPAAEVAAHLGYLTAEEIRRSAEMVCLPGDIQLELSTGLQP